MPKGSLKAGLAKVSPPKKTKYEKWWDEEKKRLNTTHATYNDYCKEKLEQIFKRPIKSKCDSCLQVAYESIRDGRTGYVTDEELISASGNRLKHK
jgi:hypothetical protein